jgi:hypothetical protein
MEERNSEKKLTVAMVTGVVIAALVVIGERILGLGILDSNGTAASIIGLALAAAKAIGDYSSSRPAKTIALVEKAKAAADPV